MFFIINNLIVFLVLAFASYTDINYREVSNYLTFGLMGYGLIANSIYFYLTLGYISVLKFLGFFALVYVIFYLFWRLGIFAGGDSKLFIGLFAVIPFNNISILQNVSPLPFIFSLFLLSVLFIFPIGAFKVFLAYFKNFKVKEFVKKNYKQKLISFLISICSILGIYFLFSYFSLPIYLYILALILIFILPKKIKYVLSIGLFISSLFLDPLLTLNNILPALIIFFLLGFVFWFFSLSKSGILNKTILITDLKEGDVLAYPLILENNQLKPLKYSFYNDLKQSLKKNISSLGKVLEKRKNIYNSIVINNILASGINKGDVLKIKKEFSEKEIELKETLPLVPSIFIAYIFMLCFGDILWLIFSII
jgi:preflagellin peptidase FlaK